MSDLSTRTLGLFTQIAPDYFTYTGLETLMLTHGLTAPEERVNKQQLVLSAIKVGQAMPPKERLSSLAGLVAELASRVQRQGIQRQSDREREFLDSLQRDGWRVHGNKLVETKVHPSLREGAEGTDADTETIDLTEPGISDVATNSRIFVVHGRDVAAQVVVARFIERLGYEAVVLHERENRGLTILEKFLMEAADAAFAVVLLNPDDAGGLREDATSGVVKDRARQNVILEFGYFVGLLGRRKVAALVSASVEIPSDLHGLLYIPFDVNRDDWKMTLAREMRSSGLIIDLNRI